MTRLLLVALLLTAGCIKTTDHGTPERAWTPIGDGIYRIDDPARNVSCYWMNGSGAVSCAPTRVPMEVDSATTR